MFLYIMPLTSFMPKSKLFTYLFIALLLTGISSAATIHGTIYDLSLKKVNNARVEINTNPKQFLIAQNGTYSFNVPNGFYTIKAQLVQKNDVIASVQENITINQDGNYVLDLILFPDIEEGIEDPGIDVNGNVIEEKTNDGILLIGFIILFVSGVVVGVFYFLRTRKKENVSEDKETSKAEEKSEDEELDNLMKIIRQEGGRTTQKDIRKQIPLSEAKISLMIAELEHKGVIEKIKKGRGNIIILKRK